MEDLVASSAGLFPRHITVSVRYVGCVSASFARISLMLFLLESTRVTRVRRITKHSNRRSLHLFNITKIMIDHRVFLV
jgi:hypothetical protein